MLRNTCKGKNFTVLLIIHFKLTEALSFLLHVQIFDFCKQKMHIFEFLNVKVE